MERDSVEKMPSAEPKMAEPVFKNREEKLEHVMTKYVMPALEKCHVYGITEVGVAINQVKEALKT